MCISVFFGSFIFLEHMALANSIYPGKFQFQNSLKYENIDRQEED